MIDHESRSQCIGMEGNERNALVSLLVYSVSVLSSSFFELLSSDDVHDAMERCSSHIYCVD